MSSKGTVTGWKSQVQGPAPRLRQCLVYRLGDDGMESSPVEDLEMLVGEKLNMSWQHALAA